MAYGDAPLDFFDLSNLAQAQQFEQWIRLRATMWIEATAQQDYNQNERGQSWRRTEGPDTWVTFQETWPDEFDNPELVSDYDKAEQLALVQIERAIKEVLDRFPYWEITEVAEEAT